MRPASFEPTGLGRGVEVTLKNVAGWPVYTTVPSANPGVGDYVSFFDTEKNRLSILQPLMR